MKTVRLALLVTLATSSLVACQGGLGSHGLGGSNANFAAPGTAPAGEVLVANSNDVYASIFHDDVANIDLAQIVAWDDSSHTGVFLSVPASMVAAAGTTQIGATTPNVMGRFGVSHEGGNSDCVRQWYFGLYTGSLVVTQGASQPGDVIAVEVSNATFEFVDENGSVNPAVVANLAMTNVLTATVDSEPIYEP